MYKDNILNFMIIRQLVKKRISKMNINPSIAEKQKQQYFQKLLLLAVN